MKLIICLFLFVLFLLTLLKIDYREHFTNDTEIVSIRETMDQRDQDNIDVTSILQKTIQIGRVPIQAIAIESPWGEVDTESDLFYYETTEERVI